MSYPTNFNRNHQNLSNSYIFILSSTPQSHLHTTISSVSTKEGIWWDRFWIFKLVFIFNQCHRAVSQTEEFCLFQFRTWGSISRERAPWIDSMSRHIHGPLNSRLSTTSVLNFAAGCSINTARVTFLVFEFAHTNHQFYVTISSSSIHTFPRASRIKRKRNASCWLKTIDIDRVWRIVLIFVPICSFVCGY